MSYANGPGIFTNNLIFCLDPGNSKSYPRVSGAEQVTHPGLVASGDNQFVNIFRSATVGTPLGSGLGVSVSGVSYNLAWNVLARRQTTSVTLRNSAGSVGPININQSPGFYSASFTANAGGSFGLFGDNVGTDCDIDYMSIKETIKSDGPTINDIVGNNNGTFTNGAYFLNTNRGMLNFDGVNDTITTSVGNILKNVGSGDFSVSTWFNSTKTSRGDLWSWKSLDSAYDIGIILNGNLGNMQLYYKTPTGGAGFYTTFNYSNNRFYHVHFQKRANNVEMYMNGVLQHSTSGGGSVLNHPEPLLYIGSNRGTSPFQGLVGPMHIYTSSLSSSQILQNYNALKGRFRL
jgi:hypothetical protein